MQTAVEVLERDGYTKLGNERKEIKMFGREKMYENYGGELKEVVASDKKGIWIAIGMVYGIFAMIAVTGIFVFLCNRPASKNGTIYQLNFAKDMQSIAEKNEKHTEKDEMDEMLEVETAVGEQTVTYYKEFESDELRIKDTLTMQASDDEVHFVQNTVEADLRAFDSETQSAIRESYDELVEQYRAIEGVTCIKEDKGDIYILHIEFKLTSDIVKRLTEQKLFEFEGEGDISLKESIKGLENNGYMRIEE